MSAFNQETVLSVHHWNDSLFSFKTTRDQALRSSLPDVACGAAGKGEKKI